MAAVDDVTRTHHLHTSTRCLSVADTRPAAAATTCRQAAGDPPVSTITTLHHVHRNRDVYRRDGRSDASALSPRHFHRDVAGDSPGRRAPLRRRSAYRITPWR